MDLRSKRAAVRRALTLVALAVAGSSALAQTTIFVDDSAATGGNGTSWASAFVTLDDALAAATAPGADEIRIAHGRYRPMVQLTPPDPRSAAFVIPDETTLIGGWLGNEINNIPLGTPRLTLLSGDIGTPGVATDNAHHVVIIDSITPQQVIDATIKRLTISDGYADVGDTRGGGIYVTGGVAVANLALENCQVKNNHAEAGGGMFFQTGDVTMKNCTFTGNTAAGRGGAMRAQASKLRCDNSYFTDNSAAGNGGVISITSTTPPDIEFVNCLFTGNSSVNGSGGVASMNSGQFSAGHGIWYDCTFSENSCGGENGGSVIYAGPPSGVSARAVLRNCVAWGNSPSATTLVNPWEVSYSDIEGALWPGSGNISANPLFTSSFSLQSGSPAIDAGSNALLPPDELDLDGDGNTTAQIPVDLVYQIRILNDIVDMGAFEMP
jgi:predicted outer membrane repeat protein